MAFALGPKARDAGTRLFAFDHIGSTNAEALVWARRGERGPAWFVTDDQREGRGRRGRMWQGTRGNLASTVLETMEVASPVAATLGFAAGLAVHAAIVALARQSATLIKTPAVRLKWPNDVLVDGEKLCGILLEAEATPLGLAVAVGMGTNVVSAPDDTPYRATSLAGIGIAAHAQDMFLALSEAWIEFVALWDQGRGFASIRERWLACAVGLDAPVAITSGASSISGIFETIDETGCMIVRSPNGRRVPIAAGEVHFGTAASAGAM